MPIDIDAVQRAEQIRMQQDADMRHRADEDAQGGGQQQDPHQEQHKKQRQTPSPEHTQEHERQLDQAFTVAPKAVAEWEEAAGIGGDTSSLMAAERAEETRKSATQRKGWKPGTHGSKPTEESPPVFESGARSFASEITDELTLPVSATSTASARDDDKVDNTQGRVSASNVGTASDRMEAHASKRSPPSTGPVVPASARLTDFAAMIADSCAGAANSLRLAAAQSVASAQHGIRQVRDGKSKEGLREVGAGLLTMASTILSISIGVTTTCLLATVDALSIGPSRPLGARESSMLHTVFGNALNCRVIRIREMSLMLRRKTASKAHGNTIYIRSDMVNNGAINPHLLVHEATHVWQYQATCPNVFARALYERLTSDEDDSWAQGIPDVSFANLRVEQQAMLLQTAHRLGFFERGSPSYGVLRYDTTEEGVATDLTAYMREAVSHIRLTSTAVPGTNAPRPSSRST